MENAHTKKKKKKRREKSEYPFQKGSLIHLPVGPLVSQYRLGEKKEMGFDRCHRVVSSVDAC